VIAALNNSLFSGISIVTYSTLGIEISWTT